MFFLKLLQALQRAKVEFAVCGGQALALHGAVRGTVDVDLVLRLNESNLSKAEKVFVSELGLVSRIPVRAEEMVKFREEYLRKRNLNAWSFANPQRLSEVVDIVITDDLKDISVMFKEAWGVKIPLVSIADLIRMKSEAGRPQDVADVEALKLIEKSEKSEKENRRKLKS